MTAKQFDYVDIIALAIAAVPEIRDSFERESARWTEEKMGPYNVFDIILVPYLRELLKQGGHAEKLQRAFAFFERLMEHPDQDVRDVVGVAVCEALASDEELLQKAARFMGPKTKASCDELMHD